MELFFRYLRYLEIFFLQIFFIYDLVLFHNVSIYRKVVRVERKFGENLDTHALEYHKCYREGNVLFNHICPSLDKYLHLLYRSSRGISL